MVRAELTVDENVKTPHRIELCARDMSPARLAALPTRKYRKRRLMPASPARTENTSSIQEGDGTLKSAKQRNGAIKSDPLKNSNAITNVPNAGTGKARMVTGRGADSHKLTEYFDLEKGASPVAQDRNANGAQRPRSRASHKLTEYFPVRRSVRKTSKCVQAEKMRNLEAAVRAQCEDGLEVMVFEGKGRGVVARQAFGRGQFVVEYVGELVGVAEARAREQLYALDPEAGCYMYYFRYGDQQYCVDATAESGRLGRLVNHSRNGNLLPKALWVGGAPRVVLVAAHDIAAGDELTYDYGDRSRESLRHHPWLAL